jgi:uncharacterized protein
MDEKAKIAKILSTAKRIAVVGLSPKPHRTSNHVSEYLQKKGYKIIPVYPREEKILGEKVYRNVSEIEGGADTVLVFRKSEEVLHVVKDAIKAKPAAFWMQEGVINEEAAALAEKNGALVVMDKCMYKEHVKSGL